MDTVFVYGTLMRREQRALDSYPTEDAAYIAEGRLFGATLVLPYGAHFPALVRHQEQEHVAGADDLYVDGELWEVSSRMLATLDRIEGVRPGREGMYRRTTVEVVRAASHLNDAAEVFTAYVYEWTRGTFTTTPIGSSWRAYLGAQRPQARADIMQGGS